MKRKLILLLLLLPTLVSAAIESNEKINVFEMKRKLQAQSRAINDMSKEIANVELSLGMQNKKYLKLSQDRAKIEESISRAKKNADFDNENLKKNYNETKSILMGVLLNKLEKSESPADLLSRKILVENLQKRLVDLQEMMTSNKDIQADVDKLYQRLDDSIKTEKALVGLMNELEQRRKDLRAQIESENQKKTEAVAQFNDSKNKMAMDREAAKKALLREQLQPLQVTEEIKIPSQPIAQNRVSNQTPVADVASGSGEFSAPISLYQGIEHNKKGVTFNFQGKNEVRAPKAGRVVYTGSLASYGNVLMIDHGNDTRTVLLGQFDYNVKNGDSITAAQVVGYTNPRSANGIGDGKIYFEVRKNNLAQNTYLLLDKKSITH